LDWHPPRGRSAISAAAARADNDEEIDVAEHPDVTAAREVLASAESALADAERRADADDILMFTGAVAAARRQLNRIIAETRGR
jgi:hypothetical protein